MDTASSLRVGMGTEALGFTPVGGPSKTESVCFVSASRAIVLSPLTGALRNADSSGASLILCVF